jgi:lauroyl/myristoyl acyltransferase
VLFRGQRNSRIEALIGRWRNTIPVRFIDAAAGPCSILQEVGAGRSVGLQMDHRFEAGEAAAYFGIEAPTLTIPARLAVKLGTGSCRPGSSASRTPASGSRCTSPSIPILRAPTHGLPPGA